MASPTVFSPKIQALTTIPDRKVKDSLQYNIDNCSLDKGKEIGQALCESCRYKNIAILRYAEANIPVEYWNLTMEKDFKGFSGLLKKYNQIIANIAECYSKGFNICFAGSHGQGKTFTSASILKYAALKGYSAFYTNLGDIISVLASNGTDGKGFIRKELMMVDFLVIDEVDPRYMASEQAADLYGRILEDIIRARVQNKLPIIMCTNSPNVIGSFNGPLQKSIGSLMKLVEVMPVLGSDFRANKGKK